MGLDYRLYTDKFAEREKEEKAMSNRLFAKKPSMAVVTLKQVCPEDPADFDINKHDPGCPKYYELKEVAGLVLKCPDSPEHFDPKIHDSQCSKVFTLKEDFSSQEINQIYTLSTYDLAQKCPATPEEFQQGYDDPACPKFYDLREVVAILDQCPEDPSKFDPKKHNESCPKVFTLKEQYSDLAWVALKKIQESDFDQDGVPDSLDLCPERPGVESYKGCPEGAEVFIRSGEFIAKKPVYFKFNSSRITESQATALGEVADIIRSNPYINRVEVQGHADSVGTKLANEKISLERAVNVVRYLYYRGVPKEVKLVPIPLGAKSPAASNKTEEGRAQNRRVIFSILKE